MIYSHYKENEVLGYEIYLYIYLLMFLVTVFGILMLKPFFVRYMNVFLLRIKSVFAMMNESHVKTLYQAR